MALVGVPGVVVFAGGILWWARRHAPARDLGLARPTLRPRHRRHATAWLLITVGACVVDAVATTVLLVLSSTTALAWSMLSPPSIVTSDLVARLALPVPEQIWPLLLALASITLLLALLEDVIFTGVLGWLLERVGLGRRAWYCALALVRVLVYVSLGGWLLAGPAVLRAVAAGWVYRRIRTVWPLCAARVLSWMLSAVLLSLGSIGAGRLDLDVSGYLAPLLVAAGLAWLALRRRDVQ